MPKQLSKTINNKLEKLLENTGDMALKRRARKIIEGIDPKDGDKILEVGCGDSYYLHLLASLGFKLNLTGMDIDPNALKSAKRNLEGFKVKLLQADLEKKIPFKSQTFDKVIMSEVCEHLKDDVRGLSEVRRVLKPGGTLIVTVPNHNYPLFWDPLNWVLEHFFGTHIKSGLWAGLWNQHIRLYKPNEIEKSVKKAGFKVEEVKSTTFWCLPFNHNLMYMAAKRLYDGGFSKDITKAISKFEKKSKRPFIIEFAFGLVNSIDKLNDIYQPKNIGVGVFVKSIR